MSRRLWSANSAIWVSLLSPQHMSVCLVNRTRNSGTTLSKMTLSSSPAPRAILSGFLYVEVHPGLIVLREGGLTRDEQWDRIRPVIEHVLESSDDNFLVNKLVEISGVDKWETREIPKP